MATCEFCGQEMETNVCPKCGEKVKPMKKAKLVIERPNVIKVENPAHRLTVVDAIAMYFVALVIPIGGIALAFYMLYKKHFKHFIALLLASLLWWGFIAGLILFG